MYHSQYERNQGSALKIVKLLYLQVPPYFTPENQTIVYYYNTEYKDMTRKGESSLTNGCIEVPKTLFKLIYTESENTPPKPYSPPPSHPWQTLLNGHYTMHTQSCMDSGCFYS